MKHSLHSACLSSTAVPAAHLVSRDLRERAGRPLRPCTQTGSSAVSGRLVPPKTEPNRGKALVLGYPEWGGYLLGDDPE